ncbi:MAG: hypothetical protein L3J63_05890 [Geopsychrobacter sp.]|nr:hypothetical protein [Geopsychrobacter sp.]
MSRYDDIITALQALQAQILIANGYRTDAGNKAWLNLEYQTEPPQKPCSILYPGEVTDSVDGDPPASLGEENHHLDIKLEGFINDTERGDQGQKLRQDFLQVINQDRTLGGLVEGIDGALKSSATIEQAGEGGFYSFVEMEFTLLYVTLWGAS